MSMISYHLSVNHVLSSAVKCCHVLSCAVMCVSTICQHPSPVACVSQSYAMTCLSIICYHVSHAIMCHMLSCVCHEHAVESVETTHLHPASSSRPPFACAFASVCVVAEVRAASRVWCHVMYMTVPSHFRAHHAHLYMAWHKAQLCIAACSMRHMPSHPTRPRSRLLKCAASMPHR